MKKWLPFPILIFLTVSINAQDEWESYLIEKEKGLMAISANLRYKYERPNYKHLLIVGTHTTKCLKNGYPNANGLEDLYTFSDSIARIVDGLTKNRLAGIITYQCAGFDIFYVKDSIDLRNKITDQINKNFNNSKTYLKLTEDKKWKYYYESLYPNDDSYDFFINNDFLTDLVYNGDDLTTPRIVTHWFYFLRDKRRQKFIDKISALDFKIDSTSYVKKRSYPYELQISRKDSINPSSISKLTKTLTDFAQLLRAEYDGWSADLITKD